jgi:hypothetical protein
VVYPTASLLSPASWTSRLRAPDGHNLPSLYQVTDRERFVPRRAAEIAQRLESLPLAHSARGDVSRWTSLSRLVAALYHHEFHTIEQRTTEAWEHVSGSPDAAEAITGDLTGLLDGANYTSITDVELDEAMQNEALIPLRLDVDFDLYDELLIYRRGARTDVVEHKRFLRAAESLEITVDADVVVHSRIKPADWFVENGIDPDKRGIVPGDASLKQFRNVPRADIEMLLPATEVRFRTVDTLKIAVPAAVSAVLVLVTKLLPTIGLLFLLAGFYAGLSDEQPEINQGVLLILVGGLAALGGFVFRQWNKLKNHRIDYLKTLSENLYFRTVADGPGVFHILLASAEEQEVNEVLIAYRLLLAATEPPTADELDGIAEQWLAEAFDTDIDFEVDDALGKLSRLGIATKDSDGRWRPLGLDEALTRLDSRWDDLFRFDSVDDDTDPQVPISDPDDEVDPQSAPALFRFRRVVDRFRNRLGERLIDN